MYSSCAKSLVALSIRKNLELDNSNVERKIKGGGGSVQINGFSRFK